MPRKMAREPNGEVPVATAAPIKKIDSVLSLLRRDEGASLADLVRATGWLPHTARAALTGLKKKGHLVDKAKIDGVTRYSITETAAR